VSVDRLIEQGASNEAESELIGLIAACEPVSVSDLGKKRSLGVVYHRHHQRRRTTRFAMRLAMASGILLVAGAATAAAFGVHWRARPAPPPVVLALAPATHHVARALPAPVAEAPAPPEPEIVAPPPAHHAHAVRSEIRAQVRSQVRSEDPSLVVSAIQALRQDHDPARASRLLADYLRTYPHGALVEEAIALSFEAADARKSPAAASFAERYLRDYPQGRFSAAAERVLARPSP
jgi:hypothetical protein